VTSPTEGGSGGASPPGIHTYHHRITSKSPSEAVFIAPLSDVRSSRAYKWNQAHHLFDVVSCNLFNGQPAKSTFPLIRQKLS